MSSNTSASSGSIRFLRALHGPNIWCRRPVLEFEVDASSFAVADWNAADELFRSQGIEGLGAWQIPAAGDGAMPAMWLGRAAAKLQTAGQTPVSFTDFICDADTGVFRVAIEFQEEPIGRAAAEFASRWLDALTRRGPFDLAREWETFLDLAYDARIGNSTGPTVEAAVARGIPFLRLDTESLVQLGQGCRQRRIRRAATDGTGMIANDISTDKELTKTLLGEIGIPLPRGRAVKDAEDAVVAAREAGWPVVVKPQDADYGNGVTMRIRSEEEVRRAWAFAREHSEGVLVEHHVPGHLFRLLVIGGRVVAALRREPWYVVGDGRRTILELIEIANHDSRRGAGYVSPILLKAREAGAMPVLTIDNRTHDSIPENDEAVLLRHDVYLKCGGIHLDQSDLIHPAISGLAVEATRAIGLDIAGLDVIAMDLSKAPDEQEMAVLEVNSEPSIALHLEPLCVPSRPVGEAIVELLFPAPDTGRIPVIGVLGSTDEFSVAGDFASKLRKVHSFVGLASGDGAWLNGLPLGVSCGSVGRHARRLWRHPRAEAVVVHVTLEDVLREGVPFDWCDQLVECPSLDRTNGGAGEFSSEELKRARECARATLTTGHSGAQAMPFPTR